MKVRRDLFFPPPRDGTSVFMCNLIVRKYCKKFVYGQRICKYENWEIKGGKYLKICEFRPNHEMQKWQIMFMLKFKFYCVDFLHL